MSDLVGSVRLLVNPTGSSVWVLADHGKRAGLAWTIVAASGSHARMRNEGSPVEQSEFFAECEDYPLDPVSGTVAAEVARK